MSVTMIVLVILGIAWALREGMAKSKRGPTLLFPQPDTMLFPYPKECPAPQLAPEPSAALNPMPAPPKVEPRYPTAYEPPIPVGSYRADLSPEVMLSEETQVLHPELFGRDEKGKVR